MEIDRGAIQIIRYAPLLSFGLPWVDFQCHHKILYYGEVLRVFSPGAVFVLWIPIAPLSYYLPKTP